MRNFIKELIHIYQWLGVRFGWHRSCEKCSEPSIYKTKDTHQLCEYHAIEKTKNAINEFLLSQVKMRFGLYNFYSKLFGPRPGSVSDYLSRKIKEDLESFGLENIKVEIDNENVEISYTVPYNVEIECLIKI